MHTRQNPFPDGMSSVAALMAEALAPRPLDATISIPRAQPFVRANGEVVVDASARMARAFRYPSARGLYPCALWLRAGLVGMLAAAGGIATLVVDAGAFVAALAWLAAGIALTAYAWHRFASAIATLDASLRDDGRSHASAPARDDVASAPPSRSTDSAGVQSADRRACADRSPPAPDVQSGAVDAARARPLARST
jgi:hypothetical protein